MRSSRHPSSPTNVSSNVRHSEVTRHPLEQVTLSDGRFFSNDFVEEAVEFFVHGPSRYDPSDRDKENKYKNKGLFHLKELSFVGVQKSPHGLKYFYVVHKEFDHIYGDRPVAPRHNDPVGTIVKVTKESSRRKYEWMRPLGTFEKIVGDEHYHFANVKPEYHFLFSQSMEGDTWAFHHQESRSYKKKFTPMSRDSTNEQPIFVTFLWRAQPPTTTLRETTTPVNHLQKAMGDFMTGDLGPLIPPNKSSSGKSSAGSSSHELGHFEVSPPPRIFQNSWYAARGILSVSVL